MSRLSRLREIVHGGTPPAPPPRREDPVRDTIYEPVDADGLPFPSYPSSALSLEGARTLRTRAGTCIVVESEYEDHQFYGHTRIGAFACADERPLRWLAGLSHDPEDRLTEFPASGDPPRIVFLDTETTGLSGGAGTVPFLVGCGSYEDGAFRVRQFFLPGFGAERALLEALRELLGEATWLVTYNGKAFDMPVLETRWSFHRMETASDRLLHLDMLHPARRFWRGPSAPDQGCRLVELEAALLGVRRVGDVPGWEIPSRYFDFVRRGDVEPLRPVLEHNRLDIVSLAALTARAVRLVTEGVAEARDVGECLALGRLFARVGRPDDAEACFRAATRLGVASGSERAEAWACLARHLRRGKRFAEAAEAWQQVLAAGPRPALGREASEALAVHHEHRARDLRTAHRFARQALDGESRRSRLEAVTWRLARLDRKLSRAAARQPVTRPVPPPLLHGI